MIKNENETNTGAIIKQSLYLSFLALLFIGFSSVQVTDAPEAVLRPNFILILTDDLGWSCLSSKMDDSVLDSKSDFFETPNIDKIATESMRFTRGYTPDPICSPNPRSIQFG